MCKVLITDEKPELYKTVILYCQHDIKGEGVYLGNNNYSMLCTRPITEHGKPIIWKPTHWEHLK